MDAEDWLRTIENNLEISGCAEGEKVLFATHYLAGSARAWWESVRAILPAGQALTWNEFKTRFRMAYVPSGLVKKMGNEFRALKQGSMSVVRYLEKLDRKSVV